MDHQLTPIRRHQALGPAATRAASGATRRRHRKSSARSATRITDGRIRSTAGPGTASQFSSDKAIMPIYQMTKANKPSPENSQRRGPHAQQKSRALNSVNRNKCAWCSRLFPGRAESAVIGVACLAKSPTNSNCGGHQLRLPLFRFKRSMKAFQPGGISFGMRLEAGDFFPPRLTYLGERFKV